MSKEILSLQSLNEKINNIEKSVNLKLQGAQPAIDNLTFIWRAITLGVIGALIIAILGLFFATVLPPIWSAVTRIIPPVESPASKGNPPASEQKQQ